MASLRAVLFLSGRQAQVWRAVLAALLSTLLTPAAGQLKIQGPRELAEQFSATNGFVYGTTATFGAPYYGERVLGQLVYGKSRGRSHCTEEDYDIPPSSAQKGRDFANVVLVRRGGCTFVTKVVIAQAKGAHAVVIVDKETSSVSSEAIQKVIMADDGFGHRVTIPSMLISSTDGHKLIDELRVQAVVVELAWDIPRGQVVSADFWMSSGSRESAEFLTRFRDSAESLRSRLHFVPHFHIFSMPSVEGSEASPLCVSVVDSCDCKPPPGKFCAPDPDGPGPITGANVANEDLRRLCISTVTAQKDATTGAQYSSAFWDYSVDFFRSCTLTAKRQSRRFGYTCSIAVMKKVGIPVPAVEDCVQRNYAAYLEEQLQNVAWSPQALRLNGWRYSGPLDPETVLQAVCSGYTTVPKECQSLRALYSSGWTRLGRRAVWRMLLFMAIVVCLPMFGFCLFKRHISISARRALREEVILEVRAQMEDYVPMEDHGDSARTVRSLCEPALSSASRPRPTEASSG